MWTRCLSYIDHRSPVVTSMRQICVTDSLSTLDHLLSFMRMLDFTGSITSLMSQISACQFFRMDLMVRICQLLMTQFLYSDTDVLQQPGALASLSCPSRNQRVWPTSHICMQASPLSMRKHLSCVLDPNCLQVFALQGVLLP